MPNITFKTLEVWNIERAGNIKSIELIAIFNVENIENKLVWALFDSKNNVISSLTIARKYLKGEAVYPKFFETKTPDGIVTMTAYLLDGNNKQISNIAAKTLYLKKAQPASGIGQRALQDPTFTLPVFPEATTTATTTAQSAELISVKVQRDIQDVYVSPEQARATEKVTVSAPFGVSFPSLPEVSAEMEIIQPTTINNAVTTNMIRQELINFSIKNNRVTGSIKFIATDSFNPYYYNKEIINYLQLKSDDKTIHIKPNRLRFTETERDETINFNESAYDLNTINAESYVWTSQDSAMSNILQFTIQEGKPTTVMPGTNGVLGAGVIGIIGILMLGGFIADHVRKRK